MKILVNHNSAIPLYLQIEEQLRTIIKGEEYKQGKMLPNEIDLSKQLGISRNTLRQAINNLVNEGLLMRKKGVGTVVVNSAVCSKAQNWMSFTQEMKTLGIVPMNYELHVSWTKPTDDIALFFNAPDVKRILKLERLRGNQEYPFVYFIAKVSKEDISARLADKYIAGKLEIKVGDPILVRKRFVYDPEGCPLEWNIGYYRADSFIYSLEFERNI